MDARSHVTRLAAFMAAVCALCVSCDRDPTKKAEEAERPSHCPESRTVDPPLQNVTPEQHTLEYWLTRAEQHGPLDKPLLSAPAITRHGNALREPVDGYPLGQTDITAPIDQAALARQVNERLAYLREKLEEPTLVDGDGEPLEAEALSQFQPVERFTLLDESRIAENLTALRCGPYPEGFYKTPIDPDFDRNRCSTIREGEVVQLLARWSNDMYLARTPYTLGWVDASTLSSPLSAEAFSEAMQPAEPKPFTRREVLTQAFEFLDSPYGWGGKDGGYDCSRFLLELFEPFGIHLPRHSARQAQAGSFAVDVTDVDDPNEKRLLIEAAARRGITLLQFPGHIMLYLGTTEDGAPMAIHAFSEFVTPCGDSEFETINRVDRVAISDLTLGDGSSRSDFLDRVTTITVIGASPGLALKADAVPRPAAPVVKPEGRCRDSQWHALFRSPARPNAHQPLRVIATSEGNPGFATLTLFGPDGEPVEAEEQRMDGPPFSRFVEVEDPAPGKWTAVLADGDQVLACDRIVVTARKPWAPKREPIAPAWATTRQWSRSTENLYSVFVEQLFRDPVDEDITWTKLQEVISDPARNLLYDYRLPGEDTRLSLKPDCADLPYFLRAYFAWKLGLPFTYRTCSRGRKDTPPVCEPIVFSNLDPEEAASDVGAFRTFVRRMGGVVHSSSPRTRPEEDATDFYPVRLTRSALRPGTVFADPYGHVLVVARWKPQGVDDYGVLIGADAQPDGTVGRRRFWRGSFLFTPNTDLVGAGFKKWRPITIEPETEEVLLATNADLQASKRADAWSDRQYRGTADDFYGAMEGLINPRPLDPVRMQISLVDALEESVQRRLNSVDNGEEFMKSNSYAPINMPSGSALFLTSGPWEDYSTPSRDMRLLISIDAVTSFPDSVATHPERFGIREADRDATVEAVQEALASELANRTFTYTRSDGSTWDLTLADLIERTPAMEVAYNPNDCVEVRWAAPEGSDEFKTCRRRAPGDQQTKMQKYRRWFATRERPH